MEPKKNPKADLSKRSVLFFQLGLILILGLSYAAIEWKTYEKEAIDIGQLNMDDVLEEDVCSHRFCFEIAIHCSRSSRRCACSGSCTRCACSKLLVTRCSSRSSCCARSSTILCTSSSFRTPPPGNGSLLRC